MSAGTIIQVVSLAAVGYGAWMLYQQANTVVYVENPNSKKQIPSISTPASPVGNGVSNITHTTVTPKPEPIHEPPAAGAVISGVKDSISGPFHSVRGGSW